MNPITALFSLGAAVVSIPFGAALGLARSLPAVRHWPRAAWNSVRVTYQTPRLGPNLKTVCLVTMPVAIVAAPVLVVVAGTAYGAGAAFVATFGEEGNIFEGMGKAWSGVGSASELLTDAMPKFSHYLPPALKDTETPYEIPLIPAIKSVVSGFVGTAIEAPMELTLCVLHAPRLVWRSFRFIWTSGKDEAFFDDDDMSALSVHGFVMRVFLSICFLLALALVTALLPILTVVGSLSLHVYRCYKRGLRRAWSGVVNDLRLTHASLRYAGTTWHKTRDREEQDRELEHLKRLLTTITRDFDETLADDMATLGTVATG